ncbi:unnamed protein product [Fusarium equiseti]|uniref:Uncharacterized protein n=1 Tax=Fusarium equiseti TaxID=61235 RepID=A0A8J2NHH3_FUSEQ|nr:unnamed protein product [Fusarium equiseti]
MSAVNNRPYRERDNTSDPPEEDCSSVKETRIFEERGGIGAGKAGIVEGRVAFHNEKLASWREAVDDLKNTEVKSALKEIKSLKEEDTKNPTSGDAQEPITTGHD